MEGITHTRKHTNTANSTVSRRRAGAIFQCSLILCVPHFPRPPLPQKPALPKSLKTSPPPACSYKTNICAEAPACYSNKYITLIMRRYPNLPRRGFKAPVRDVSERVTRLRDETAFRSHAPELLGGRCSNGRLRRLELPLQTGTGTSLRNNLLEAPVAAVGG